MKIIMKTVSAGPNGNRFPGIEYEVSEQDGADLVLGGYAVEVGPVVVKKEVSESQIERAVEPPKESAIAQEGRPSARRRR